MLKTTNSEVIRDTEKIKKIVTKLLLNSDVIGFIPVFKHLHNGYINLFELSRSKSSITIVIFLNNFIIDKENNNFVHNLAQDIEICKNFSVDYIFIPPKKEFIIDNSCISLNLPPHLGATLSGAFKPEYFSYLITIILKFLNLTRAKYIFVNEIYWQFITILRQLIDSFYLPFSIITSPIVRDPSGIAFNDNYIQLTPDEKNIVKFMYESLQFSQALIDRGEDKVSYIRESMEKYLSQQSQLFIQYIAFVDPFTLTPITRITKTTLIEISAYINNINLIDNLLVAPNKQDDLEF